MSLFKFKQFCRQIASRDKQVRKPRAKHRLAMESLEARLVLADFSGLGAFVQAKLVSFENTTLSNSVLNDALPVLGTALQTKSTNNEILKDATDAFGGVDDNTTDRATFETNLETALTNAGLSNVDVTNNNDDSFRVQFDGSEMFMTGFASALPILPISSGDFAATIGYAVDITIGVDGAGYFIDASASAKEVDLSAEVKNSDLPTLEIALGGLVASATPSSATGNAFDAGFAIDIGGNLLRAATPVTATSTTTGGADVDLDLELEFSVGGLTPKLESDFNLTFGLENGDPDPTATFADVTLDVGSMINGFGGESVASVLEKAQAVFDLARKLDTPLPGLDQISQQIEGLVGELDTVETGDDGINAILRALGNPTLLNLLDGGATFLDNNPKPGTPSGDDVRAFTAAVRQILEVESLVSEIAGQSSLTINFGTFQIGSSEDLETSTAELSTLSPIFTAPSTDIGLQAGVDALEQFLADNDLTTELLMPAKVFELLAGSEDVTILEYLKDVAPIEIASFDILNKNFAVGIVPVNFQITSALKVDPNIRFGFDSRGLSGDISKGIYVGAGAAPSDPSTPGASAFLTLTGDLTIDLAIGQDLDLVEARTGVRGRIKAEAAAFFVNDSISPDKLHIDQAIDCPMEGEFKITAEALLFYDARLNVGVEALINTLGTLLEAAIRHNPTVYAVRKLFDEAKDDFRNALIAGGLSTTDADNIVNGIDDAINASPKEGLQAIVDGFESVGAKSSEEFKKLAKDVQEGKEKIAGFFEDPGGTIKEEGGKILEQADPRGCYGFCLVVPSTSIGTSKEIPLFPEQTLLSWTTGNCGATDHGGGLTPGSVIPSTNTVAPVLGEEVDGILTLFIGPNASRRNVQENAIDEHVLVQPLDPANPDNGKVIVRMFGATQEFMNVTHIFADAGDGNNSIDARGVGATTRFIGGDGDDTFFAGLGAASFFGGDGFNQMTGSPEEDTLIGGSDRDVIVGQGAADFISGGDGDDELIGDLRPGTTEDTSEDPAFSGDDTIIGGTGNDFIYGGRGSDFLDGGLENDIILGGVGNDSLFGSGGHDYLDGGDDQDDLFTGQGNSTLRGGAGNDRLNAGDGINTLRGDEGVDTLVGGGGHDFFIYTEGDGDDTIDGGGGQNTLVADFGSDGASATLEGVGSGTRLFGSNSGGAFSIDLTSVDEFLVLLTGDGSTFTVGDLEGTTALFVQAVFGAEGTEPNSLNIHGTPAADDIEVAAVDDEVTVHGLQAVIQALNTQPTDRLTVSANSGDDSVKAQAGVEDLIGVTLEGDDGDDYLSADAILNGGAGDDVLEGLPGSNDIFNGGAGFDTVLISGTPDDDLIDVMQTSASALTVDLNGTVDNETLNSIEQVRIAAGEGDDVIRIKVDDSLFVPDADPDEAVFRYHVLGGSPNASDYLNVVDDGLGDLIIQRIGDDRSGTFSFAPAHANGAAPPIVYEGIEKTFVTPINAITSGTGTTDSAGRLVVFKRDEFESNDTLATATYLGSGATLNVDPNIDPGPGPLGIPGDEDWYQLVAQETGILDLQVYFELIGELENGRTGLPLDGELNIEVRDASGDMIGNGTVLNDGADNPIGKRVAIPVVRNQSYYLRVQGASGAAAGGINTYNITAINVPAPVPQTIDLQAASDSGRNDSDDVTNDTTPTFDIILDDDRIDEFMNLNLLPDTNDDDMQTTGFDYGVEVFNNGASIGFAFYTGTGNLWQFTASAGDLNEGHNNFITAATWVRDRATPNVIGTSDQQGPINALQVTLDTEAPPKSFGDPAVANDGLHPDSDTGIADQPNLSIDRITSDTTPMFFGEAEANSIIRAFVVVDDNDTPELGDDTLVEIGKTVAIPLDGDEAFPNGAWELTSNVDMNNPEIFAALPEDGIRTIRITAEDKAGNVSEGMDLQIFIDTRGPQVEGVFVSDDRDYDLFDPKPSEDGPTPNVDSLDIDFIDQPPRGEGGTSTSTDMVDVFVVFDDTGSFSGVAPTLIAQFPNIIANLQASLPSADLAFGVGRFEDFGNGSASATGNNLPFILNQAIVSDDAAGFLAAINSALNRTAPGGGSDTPESGIEALFQLATGQGYDGDNNGSVLDNGNAGQLSGANNPQTSPGASGDVPDFASYTPEGDELPAAGTLGGAGFRTGARKIIILATDTGTRYFDTDAGNDAEVFTGLDGVMISEEEFLPGRDTEFSGPVNPGHGIQETIDALNALGVTVIGLGDNADFDASGPRDYLEAVSRLTGSINNTGASIESGIAGDPIDPGDPLYFEIDPNSAENVANAIVAAVQGAVGGSSGFLYPAVNETLSTDPGNYRLVGDANGIIAIESIEFIDNTVPGDIGRTTIRLNFFEPLPDDRYTLTIVDDIKDDAGNQLDGQSNASEPQETPDFPSGDGDPGGTFVARFTVDSRPELGTWSGGSVWVDTNGNFRFDPENPDEVNEDIVYQYGFASDDIFAGNFVEGANAEADGFDKIAAYGRGTDGAFRWLIDVDNDGVADLSIEQPAFGSRNINAHPVAGNFDSGGVAADDSGNLNGDEVGLFNGTHWLLDTDHNFMVDTAIKFQTADGQFVGGLPVVGDFDGDGYDDLATWRDDVFYFDLTATNLAAGGPRYDGIVDAFFRFGFIGIREVPVAADFNNDGIDDIGLWVPDRSGATPAEDAEWYILVSGGDEFGAGIDNNTPDGNPDTVLDRRVTAPVSDQVPDDVFGVAPPIVQFTPDPFGNDFFAQLGDEFALPIVGNFDPPVTVAAADTGPGPQVLEGTTGDDVITVELGEQYRININGVETVIDPATVTSLAFFGGGGNDTLVVKDKLGAIKATLSPGELSITGSGIELAASDFSTTRVAGSEEDRAWFYDSQVDDSFIGKQGMSRLTNGAFDNRTYGFGWNKAIASAGGDKDKAYFYDTAGNDKYVANAQEGYAYMASEGVSNIALGFDQNRGYANKGANDKAYFYDTDGNDAFVSRPDKDYAYLKSADIYNYARGFDKNLAYAINGGAKDRAFFYGTTGDDLLSVDASIGDVSMTSGGSMSRARGFESNIAEATDGGNDVAYIENVLAADIIFGRSDYLDYDSRGQSSRLSGFDRISASTAAGETGDADVDAVDYLFETVGDWLS